METAALYGLEVLVPSINTDGDNTTRFIVLSREKPTAGNRFPPIANTNPNHNQ
jgi:chorismate mutase/prephenate dehydratase